jgi:hypothetical protein
MKSAVIALLILLPLAPLHAADEPEAVYAKYHRAVMAGQLEEMLVYGPTQRRIEIRGSSASSQDAALKMAKFMMPRAFTLERKTITGKGRATLIVSGPGEVGGNRLQPIYGTVSMLMENGEWKVDEVSWNNERPAILATPKPGASPAAAEKAVPKFTGKGGQVVGTTTSATLGRTLGEAKPVCVYKPVMTAADMEACK